MKREPGRPPRFRRLFQPSCGETDRNGPAIPAGRLDVTARPHLPHEEVGTGAWTPPGIELR